MGKPEKLELTEEEAFSLLSLCLTSELALDGQSEQALKKLAEYCKAHQKIKSNYHKTAIGGFCEAG